MAAGVLPGLNREFGTIRHEPAVYRFADDNGRFGAPIFPIRRRYGCVEGFLRMSTSWCTRGETWRAKGERSVALASAAASHPIRAKATPAFFFFFSPPLASSLPRRRLPQRLVLPARMAGGGRARSTPPAPSPVICYSKSATNSRFRNGDAVARWWAYAARLRPRSRWYKSAGHASW